jgi:hypothetical protein
MTAMITNHVLLTESKHTKKTIQKHIEMYWLRKANPKDTLDVYYKQLAASCSRTRIDFQTGVVQGEDFISGLFSHAALAPLRLANTAAFFIEKTKIYAVVCIKPVKAGEALTITWCPSQHKIIKRAGYLHEIIQCMNQYHERQQQANQSWISFMSTLDSITNKYFYNQYTDIDTSDTTSDSTTTPLPTITPTPTPTHTTPTTTTDMTTAPTTDNKHNNNYKNDSANNSESKKNVHDWDLFLFDHVWKKGKMDDTKKENTPLQKKVQVPTEFDDTDVLIEDAANKSKEQIHIAKKVLALSYKHTPTIIISWDDIVACDLDYDWIQNVIDSGCHNGHYKFANKNNDWYFTYCDNNV